MTNIDDGYVRHCLMVSLAEIKRTLTEKYPPDRDMYTEFMRTFGAIECILCMMQYPLPDATQLDGYQFIIDVLRAAIAVVDGNDDWVVAGLSYLVNH